MLPPKNPATKPLPDSPTHFRVTGTIGAIEPIIHDGSHVILDVLGEKVCIVAWSRARSAILEVGVGGRITAEGTVRSRAFVTKKGEIRWNTSLKAESVSFADGPH